jgi:hypothetical protein
MPRVFYQNFYFMSLDPHSTRVRSCGGRFGGTESFKGSATPTSKHALGPLSERLTQTRLAVHWASLPTL